MARPLSNIWTEQADGRNDNDNDPNQITERKYKSFTRVTRIVKAAGVVTSVPAKQKSNQPAEPLTDKTIDAAWLKFWNTKSPSLRKRIIEYYLPLASKIGNTYKKVLPYRPLVEGCDLINDASIGMIQAVDAFDPYRGIKFETFCKKRMFGAIYDNLREMQHFPRSTSRLKREIRNLTAAFVEKFGREPSDVEFIAEYGVEYQEILNDPLLRSNVYNQGLSQQCGDNESLSGRCSEDFESKYLAVDGSVDAIDDQTNEEEVFELCGKHLPNELYREAIKHYFGDNMTLKDTGKALVALDDNPKPFCPSTVSKMIKISCVILRQVPGLKEKLQSKDYK